VALNYQTPCVQMHLNDSKFRENGNCGYVLKPPHLLQPVMPKPGFRLVVNVISAQRLPKPEGETKGEVSPFLLGTSLTLLSSALLSSLSTRSSIPMWWSLCTAPRKGYPLPRHAPEL
jgi:hypothetical protein